MADVHKQRASNSIISKTKQVTKLTTTFKGLHGRPRPLRLFSRDLFIVYKEYKTKLIKKTLKTFKIKDTNNKV